MQAITVTSTSKEQVIDITDQVNTFVLGSGVDEGMCLIAAAHTTCAITTADLDPGTDRDLLQALRSMLPPQTYRHPHNPAHAPDHILSSIIGPSVLLPLARKRLVLGTWQRVVLVELDGPRPRTVHLVCK